MFIPGQIVENWNVSHAGKLQRRLLREPYTHDPKYSLSWKEFSSELSQNENTWLY